MIAPTSRAIVLTVMGAPLALVIAALAPGLWPLGAAWALAVFALVILDAAIAPAGRDLTVSANTPRLAGVAAGPVSGTLTLDFGGRRDPPALEAALETNDLMRVEMGAPVRAAAGGVHSARFKLDLIRRGEGVLRKAFVRWRGPLGLAWREAIAPMAQTIAITPDIEGVERAAAKLFSRTQNHGVKPLRDRGDGSEFDALTEFEPGMDRRLIDWKQTARHNKLLAKEVRAERNHQIVFAIDTGRLMCEPAAGAPRIDWALNAGLMLGYVALRLGDRVSFFGFDAKPNLAMGFVAGPRAFANLQTVSAKLDYSSEETNFTLGLATLAERLKRRSMIVVFTDFADSTSAELMLENLTRLARRHMIVFVAFRDETLETLRAARPETPDDVSRAVIADQLLRERDIVVARLRRLGAYIVSAPVDKLGPALIRAYDELRRRERV